MQSVYKFFSAHPKEKRQGLYQKKALFKKKTLWEKTLQFGFRMDPNGQIGFAAVKMVDESNDMDAESAPANCECCGWCWLWHICFRMTWGCCCACADLATNAKM